mmetsp:Transcript_28077/g.74079  ORF Transcript_28077/g.74079 Transcript_28077/m.74079 type:complete len:181 (+) Transcript_28077:400-942(+)
MSTLGGTRSATPGTGFDGTRSVTPFEGGDSVSRRHLNVDPSQLSTQVRHEAYPLTRSTTPALQERHVLSSMTQVPGDYPMQQEDAARIHYMRPAGLSKSIAGRKLGLNYDFKCDTTPIAPDGGFHLSQGPFRSAPVWPNYLIDLVRARAHLPPFPCDMGEGPYPPQTNFVRAAGPTAHWR